MTKPWIVLVLAILVSTSAFGQRYPGFERWPDRIEPPVRSEPPTWQQPYERPSVVVAPSPPPSLNPEPRGECLRHQECDDHCWDRQRYSVCPAVCMKWAC
jgi:hypothetical protein